jgi:hypothetical protein
MRRTLIIAASVTALLTIRGQAQAQANRTFVSGHGDDNNACSLAAPCRSFAGAIAKTNAGGEITVLDSAGYGPVTISQSVTITNPGGVEAGITAVSGQSAITINGPLNGNITLRGLTLEGGGFGQNGIVGIGSGTVDIIGCVIKGFGNGIDSPGAVVNIADTFVLNNGTGIMIQDLLKASITRTAVTGNGTGINLGGAFGLLDVIMSDIDVNNNSTVGISTTTSAGNYVLKHSTVAFNGGANTNSDIDISLGSILILNNTYVDKINIGIAGGNASSDGTNVLASVTGLLPNKGTR